MSKDQLGWLRDDIKDDIFKGKPFHLRRRGGVRILFVARTQSLTLALQTFYSPHFISRQKKLRYRELESKSAAETAMDGMSCS